MPPAAPLPARQPPLARIGGALLLVAVAAWSAAFLADVSGRYRQLDPATYALFWDRRAWLWTHLAGGMLTLLLGPVQFMARGLRAWRLHRWSGRLFLAGMLVACTGAAGLVATSPAPASIRIAFAATALVWLTTALAGLVSVRRGRAPEHGAWMIRCYLVTLAPVTFRAALHLPGVFAIVPAPPAGIAWLLWLSWLVPLLAYEAGRRARRALSGRRPPPAGAMPAAGG